MRCDDDDDDEEPFCGIRELLLKKVPSSSFVCVSCASVFVPDNPMLIEMMKLGDEYSFSQNDTHDGSAAYLSS
jgi:hypothetical protein